MYFLSRRKTIWLVLGLVVGLISLYQSARYSFHQNGTDVSQVQGRVDLQEFSEMTAVAPAPAKKEKVLRVAVAPMISPEKSFGMYLPFVEYLASRLGRKPQLIQRQTYAEVNELIRYGKCDLAFVCDYPFVKGERDFGMKALVVPQVRGEVHYCSLILVPHSSTAHSLLDLKGKSFASADTLSNTGWLFPAVWLKKRGKDPVSFFSHLLISGSHDRSVKAVLEGYSDGAAVNSLVYEQMLEEDPLIGSRVRIILKSPTYGMPPLVVSKRINPELKNTMLKALLEMNKNPAGGKILSGLKIDRFLVPGPGFFDSVRASVNYWEGTL